jgi:dephospho-CoA kinase
MASIIFESPSERRQLELIIHPIVSELARQAIASCSVGDIVVYNVPLLVEAKVSLPFDFVVTVEAPESAQVERLIKIRQMTSEEALKRIRSQATPAQRAARADVILSSNQSLGRLIDDTEALWARIRTQAESKSGS